MISAEPATRIRVLAQTARRHPDLISALCEGSPKEIRIQLHKAPEFRQLYEEYLKRFGDRCMEELKLESSTLFDDPLPLLRSIGNYARRLGAAQDEAPGRVELELRRQAEERVGKELAGHPVRRLLFGWVQKQARDRVRDRENLRFERTRLFGRVRAIMVEIGKRFHSLDLLEDARDIFYLELQEILAFIEGAASCTDLKGLVDVRKAEFARYRELPRPGDRFETHGLVYCGHEFQRKTALPGPGEGETGKGLGCCPGVVKGRVRVITDPKGAILQTGEILVAERTDPGWIMLFPSAAGLLVERGSLLSHSAIVAREMGIPAIVSITDVTRWLQTGDLVEMDGSTGIVTRLSIASMDPAHAE